MAYKRKDVSAYMKPDTPPPTTPYTRPKQTSLTPQGERRGGERVRAGKPLEQTEGYKLWARTKGLKRTFIAYYADCGVMSIACAYADVSPKTVKKWLDHDADFRLDYDDATDMAVGILEHEARRRALAGSDRLLEFLLKSLRPEVYRERYEVKQEVAGDYIIDISNPGQTTVTSAIHGAADDVLDEPPAV